MAKTPPGVAGSGGCAAACARCCVAGGGVHRDHNEKSTHQIPPQPGEVPDMERYIAYVKAQVTELLTSYGEVVCFFWDIPTGIELHLMGIPADELANEAVVIRMRY